MSDDPFGDLFGEQEETVATAEQPAEQPEAGSESDQVEPRRRGGSIVFDVETGPRPWEEIECFFAPPPHPGEFDEATVKFGNTKDPTKRREKVEEARAKHAAAVEKWQGGSDEAKAEFLGRAALSPLTGQVVAIGYWERDFASIIGVGQSCPIKADGRVIGTGLWSEAMILAGFWETFREAKAGNQHLVGHNIFRFDLPFIIRRSWLLGVDVPGDVLRDGRYWHRAFADTMTTWGCGVYGETISLDTVSHYFGEPGKNGDGAEFARLWHGTEEERLQAINYLKRDLTLTAAVAKRMGVI